MRKRDNSFASIKLMARKRAIDGLDAAARVLELFCGSGLMYDLLWRDFRFGATLDLDEKKVVAAATERPTWAVYLGNAETALRGGWMKNVPWDVIDIDSYGSPWPFLLAWASGQRRRAEVTRIVLTDGYMSRVNVTRDGCRALFGGKSPGGIGNAEYMREVRSRLAVWGAEFELQFSDTETAMGPRSKMATHLLMARDVRQVQPARA